MRMMEPTMSFVVLLASQVWHHVFCWRPVLIILSQADESLALS